MNNDNLIQNNLNLLKNLGFKQGATLNFDFQIDEENSVFVYTDGNVFVANYDDQVFLSQIKTIAQLEALVKLLRGEEILSTNQNQMQP